MIRWIRERLGTASYEQVDHDRHFLLDVRHLVDKAGNPTGPIADIISKGVDAYRSGASVVVSCDFGISRSNALAAGILSVIETIPYDDAVREVVRTTGEGEIKLDMVAAVRTTLEGTLPESNRSAVLVTGASGFIGRALVATMADTQPVFAPSRQDVQLSAGAVPFEEYCRDKEIATVVHLAYPRVYTNTASSGESITMLRNVLDVCAHLDIRLVFVSGWVVFAGYPSTSLTANESFPMRPKGVYGDSKFLEEQLVELYFSRGDIRRTVCRLAPVYGPGGERPRLIKTFYTSAMSGNAITTHRYRNGLPALDLLYIDDAVDGLRRALSSTASETYHFGRGDLRTTAELADLISAQAGRIVERHELLVDEDTSNIILDGSKARTELGWNPRIAPETGLALTLKDV